MVCTLGQKALIAGFWSAAAVALAQPAAPTVSVTLVKAESRELPLGLDLTGTVSARRSVDVRAQTAATVRSVLVREGESVRQGQTLFQLDDRNERAQLERAQAQVLRDEAALAEVRRQLRRSEELLAQNFLSQGAVDAQRTAVQSQEATLAAARAAAHAAQVALSFMTITAPQDGRLGAITVQPGAYVSPGGTPLVTISQLHPALVTFPVPQRHLMDALLALKSKARVVEVRPAEGAPYASPSAQAPVVFVDNAIDGASGTVRVRAEIDNADSRWWPGTYVKVRMNLQPAQGGTVIPAAAVVHGARGRSVFVVNDENVAQVRPVEVLAIADGQAAVKGLAAGERVVLDGRQNLRNGSKVADRGATARDVAPTPGPGKTKDAAAR